MSLNLIEAIQEKLGAKKVEKVDPNTQEAKHSAHSFHQAAIPTVLIGLYKYGNTEIGANEILHGSSRNWFEEFFGANAGIAVEKVSGYTGKPQDEVRERLETTATEAVQVIRENAPKKATPAIAKEFIFQQRSAILKRLPAELQIGELFDDDTIDDRTNKMEGPMSNHMHFLEKLFGGGVTEDKKIKKND
jgi:hypothetical protein